MTAETVTLTAHVRVRVDRETTEQSDVKTAGEIVDEISAGRFQLEGFEL